MKLKIDTVDKTIQVEQQCKLTELFNMVKKLFPNDEWREYSIEAVQYLYNWGNPGYIPTVWQPNYISEPFTISCTGTDKTVYCIQTN